MIIAPDIPTFKLPPSIRHPFFRAIKEALSNAAKHARATTVTVDIRSRDATFVVTVADDGKGFDLSESHSGNGLAFMRARLDEIGGNLAIETAPGRGVRITFTLPLRDGPDTCPDISTSPPANL